MTDLRIALGTIPFGTSVDDSTSFDLLDRFVAGGGTRIDTANNYPFWVDGASGDESELALGRWLVSRRTRDRVVLGTKCGGRPTNGRTLDSTEGLSAPAIRHAVEGSLRRLQTDSIDVYWAHVEDRSVPREETVGAFDELAAQGVVREVGASTLPSRPDGDRGRAAVPCVRARLDLRGRLRLQSRLGRPGRLRDGARPELVGEATEQHVEALRPAFDGLRGEVGRRVGVQVAGHVGGRRRLRGVDGRLREDAPVQRRSDQSLVDVGVEGVPQPCVGRLGDLAREAIGLVVHGFLRLRSPDRSSPPRRSVRTRASSAARAWRSR